MIDLDGTLVDSIADLATAANAMRVELGRVPLLEATIRGYVGQGIGNLVMRCLDEKSETSPDVMAALPLFKQHYHRSNGQQTVLFPGVREGLESLRNQGLPLVCITNKAAAFTEPLLEKMKLREFFTQLISGDTLTHKKPHPMPLLHACQVAGVSPAEALMIGDSEMDVLAARRAGCPVVCVPYGYNEGRDVRALESDAIMASLIDIAENIKLLAKVSIHQS